MSIKIETSAGNGMLQSLDPLKTTTDAMQLFRFWVEVYTPKQWYDVIREANKCYAKTNWRCQGRVRRKLESNWSRQCVRVWFDVPDKNFASWVGVKLGLTVVETANK